MAEDLPDPAEAPTAEEEAAALEQTLEGFDDAVTVVATEPPPLGRSWAFDFNESRFEVSPTSRAPAETYGVQTLTTWCVKALQTAQGAHVIYPSDYGMREPNRWIGRRLTGADYAQMETDVHDALTFHPRIVNVVDFLAEQDPNQEYVEVSFTIVLDTDERIGVIGTLEGE